MRIALVCAAALAAAPLVVSAQDAGSRLSASCAMCHGTAGHSVGGNVPLAGMPRDDLVRAMKEFQSGARPATAGESAGHLSPDPGAAAPGCARPGLLRVNCARRPP